MINMLPLESSPQFFGVFNDAMVMRETRINNQDFTGGDTCSISDPTVASTDYYNISSSPVKDYRAATAAKNDVVCPINVEDKDKSWLRLGIGPDENNHKTASYKLQRCSSQNRSGRDKSSLDLSLFSSTATVQPPYPHDQLLTMSVYNHRLMHPQTLLNRPSSKPWIPQYTAPFRPSSLSGRDVTNNNSAIRSCCVDEGGAGPSSEFRVIDPPRRPHSGLWFHLQASQFQEKEPFLPQVSKSYLRIKDGRITVRLLIKYLMKKLQLDTESEEYTVSSWPDLSNILFCPWQLLTLRIFGVKSRKSGDFGVEIRCRGQQLSPLMTMQHVRDTIWTPKSTSSSSFTLLRDSSTADHVMLLHYGRTTA